MQIILLSVVLVIVCANYALGNDIFDISVTRAECIDHNETICKNHFCFVKRFRNNSNLFSTGCEVIYSPIVNVRVTIFYKYGIRYIPFLINVTRNVCDALKNDKPGAVDKIVIEPIKKYSNIVQCPFKGNYSLLDIPASAVNLPLSIPAGDFRLDFRIFNEKNQTLIFPRVYITVNAKGKHILGMG